MKNSIFICSDPVETFWRFGNTSMDGNFILLGWKTYPKPVDAGMPDAVAKVLASAMTSLTRVIFLSSDLAQTDVVNEWNFSNDKTVCVLKEPNSLKQLAAFLSGGTSHIALVATRTPQEVEQSLDDSMWALETQIILLSNPERILPEIDWRTLVSLFGDNWTKHALQLQNIGVQGVIRPGVDGDVAGILFLTDAFRQTFLEVLKNQCFAAGFDWQVLSETDFSSSLADS